MGAQIQEWVSLVGKTFPHLVGVFCTRDLGILPDTRDLGILPDTRDPAGYEGPRGPAGNAQNGEFMIGSV